MKGAVYLTEAAVERLLTMPAAIEAVEEAFRKLAEGQATNVPRSRAKAPGIVLHTMSAAAPYLGLVGWKCYTTTRHGALFHVGVYDAESGRPKALIEGDLLGQMRTGAATAVAAKWMALPDADQLGLFGTGWQARSQLAAVAAVRPIKQAFVYSRAVARRAQFAEEMSAKLSLTVTAVDEPQQAAENLPIVITATSSSTPVLEGQWLSAGTFVAAVGSNWLNKAEIDVDVVRRADLIVCDSVEGCRGEAGDFVAATEQNVFKWDQAVELADIVSGRATGRRDAADIVLFKSVGMAIEDLAVASRVLAELK